MKVQTCIKAGDSVYQIREGDTLIKIAQAYYGANAKADDVIRIYTANKTTIGADPCSLQVGTGLLIPDWPPVPVPPQPTPVPPKPKPHPKPQPTPDPGPVGACQEFWGNGVCLYKQCPYPPFTMDC